MPLNRIIISKMTAYETQHNDTEHKDIQQNGQLCDSAKQYKNCSTQQNRELYVVVSASLLNGILMNAVAP
jgi:hypothetical protein